MLFFGMLTSTFVGWDTYRFHVFGTLVGAQKLDLEDLIPLTPAQGNSGTVTWNFIEIGPPRGKRKGAVQPLVYVGTSPTEDLAAMPMLINTVDGRVHQSEQIVTIEGVVSTTGDDHMELQAQREPTSGIDDPVLPDQPLTLCYLSETKFLAAANARVPGGWTGAQFIAAFGHEANEKRFLGTVFTAAMTAVRILSQGASLANVAVKLVREVRGNTQDSMIAMIPFEDDNFWTDVRDVTFKRNKKVLTSKPLMTGKGPNFR